MSGGIKGNIAQTIRDVGEAVISPTIDKVGESIEMGVQSVAGTVMPPAVKSPEEQAAQQKRVQEDQKKKVWAQHVIAWNKKIDEDQLKVRMEQQKKEQERLQEEKRKQEVRQFTIEQKKKENPAQAALKAAARKAETKMGRGMGG